MLQITIKEHSSKASYGFVGQEAMSWQEFGKEVENYSQLLAQKGIGYGDKVALISPNMPQWCVAYYSIINLGAVVVPILTEFSEHEMLNIIEHSEAKAIFVHQKFEFKLKELKNDNILVLEISEGETIRDTNINIENPSLFNKVEPSDGCHNRHFAPQENLVTLRFHIKTWFLNGICCTLYNHNFR